MMNEKDRITSLVVRLQNGDNSAFDELYKLTCSKVYFVSLKITKNEHVKSCFLKQKAFQIFHSIFPKQLS